MKYSHINWYNISYYTVMDNDNMPLDMINHIGSFLDLDDFFNLCTAHRGMNTLFHHPIGRSVYIDRYTREIKCNDHYTEWRFNGYLHREHDQPAVVVPDGTQAWYYHGKCHRENDQPAIVFPDGYKAWYYHGKLHRENDQPAIVRPDGSKQWWYHGSLCREHE